MQRKAVSQQTEMSRPPVLCALAAQRATVPWRPEHSRWRSVPRSLTVCVLHRTSRCRSTRSFAAQPSPVDRSVERHGGLLHGLAGALLRFCAACRAVVRRFTTQPSPGDRFCRPPRRSASWPCQALRSGFAQQIAQALDVLPGHRGRHDVARRLGRWRSRRRWCWRCRAGLLGPRIEIGRASCRERV